MSQTPAALRDLTRHLHAQGRLRVWSVIVTILGEIAQPEGGKISMASLLEICAALNIEPQAVRTAMSRLSKDGLVAGKREGRTAHYQFSPQGLAEYCRAATVIYAAPKSLVDWVFAFAAEGADAAELQKTFASNPPLVLGGRCYVCLQAPCRRFWHIAMLILWSLIVSPWPCQIGQRLVYCRRSMPKLASGSARAAKISEMVR